jgi:hypothetical protein
MIALGFHYLTDAMGGAAVGIGTVLATALVIDMVMLAWLRSHESPLAVDAEEAGQNEADARSGRISP